MAVTKIIKRRIRSAKNIKQITKAMEMVSASKMRRSQEKALTARPYSTKLREILAQLAVQIRSEKHLMLLPQKETGEGRGSRGIILVSSDRGLCGALNTNLFRALDEFKLTVSREHPQDIITYDFIAIGKKSREYVLTSGQSLSAEEA